MGYLSSLSALLSPSFISSTSSMMSAICFFCAFSWSIVFSATWTTKNMEKRIIQNNVYRARDCVFSDATVTRHQQARDIELLQGRHSDEHSECNLCMSL